MAALLGADEYSFGTAAMLAEGCIMVRACATATPARSGVATQRPGLRAKFAGTPEGVVTYHALHRRGGPRAPRGPRVPDPRRGDRTRRVPPPAPQRRLRRRPWTSRRCSSPADPDAPRRFVAHNPVQRPRSELDARLLEDAFATCGAAARRRSTTRSRTPTGPSAPSLGGADRAVEFGQAPARRARSTPASPARGAVLRRVRRRRRHAGAHRRGPGLRRQGPRRRTAHPATRPGDEPPAIPSSPATPAATAPPAVSSSPRGGSGSASAFATRARPPSSKGSATTPAST